MLAGYLLGVGAVVTEGNFWVTVLDAAVGVVAGILPLGR